MSEPVEELRRWAMAHAGSVRNRRVPPPAGAVSAGPKTPIRLDVSERATRIRVAEPGVYAAAAVAWATTDTGQPLLATASNDGTARIWNPHTGHTITTLTGHTNTVRSVAWATTNTGQLLLATGSSDRTARIWNPHTGDTITTLTGHTGLVWSVAWATTDTGQLLLATASSDNTARIWNPHTGHTITTLTGHTDTVLSVAWATTDTGQLLLATASWDGTVRIWNPHTGHTITTLTEHTDTVLSVAWATTNTGQPLLATASNDGTARIWNPHTGHTITTLTGHTNTVQSVAWATTNTGQLLLATASWDGTVRIWDHGTGESLAVVERPQQASLRDINGLAWHVPSVRELVASSSGDGRLVETLLLATAGDDGGVWIHEISHTLPAPPAGAVAAASLDPPAGALAAIAPGTIHVPEADPVELAGHTGLVWSLAWATTNTGQPLLATASSDNTARIWNPYTGDTITTLTGHTDTVRSVAWGTTDTGQLLLATASGDNTARIWNPHTGDTITTLTGHTGLVQSVAWATTDTGQPLIATTSHDNTTRIWNPHTGHTITTLTEHTNTVWSVAWATTDTGQLLIATASTDGTTRIWNPHTGHTITTLTEHTGAVLSVAWATTDTGQLLIATTSNDNTARIWNPHTGHTITTLTGHTDTVWSVAWSTTGGRLLLATASEDGSARVWDPYTGTTLADMVHPSPVNAVAWRTTPTGALTLTTGCDDSKIREFVVVPASVHIASRPVPRTPAGKPPKSVPGLLALGRRGLWPPLGLVEDLVELTGADRNGELNDPELDWLTRHPLVLAMRELGWPAASRVAMAALLTADHKHNPGYAAPVAADPVALTNALSGALAARHATPPPPAMPAAAVHAAADAVPPAAVDLLAILGPEVSAEDPSLVLRLAGSMARLPALDSRIRGLLCVSAADGSVTETASTVPVDARVERLGDPLLARHGDPHRMVATHLALPERPRAVLAAGGNLLYRRRSAEPHRRPTDRVLVLDTSPPTYGPVESVLRLVAHLVTTALWRAGAATTLLTAERPDSLIPLTRPRDLLHLWTGRTLVRPDLAALAGTAGGHGQPVIVLTHYETARWAGLIRDTDHRVVLLTSHTPTTAEPRPTAANHHHLAATATAEQIDATVRALLGDPA